MTLSLLFLLFAVRAHHCFVLAHCSAVFLAVHNRISFEISKIDRAWGSTRVNTKQYAH